MSVPTGQAYTYDDRTKRSLAIAPIELACTCLRPPIDFEATHALTPATRTPSYPTIITDIESGSLEGTPPQAD